MRATSIRAAVVIAAAVAAGHPGPARAAGPNGGAVAVADGHPVEFVASDREILFFVTDEDGRPLQTAGLAAKAFVTVGGRTETLILKPAAPNRLTADLKAPLPPGAKVVLSAKVHGHGLQARFER